jgi:NagD protein
MFFIDVQGTLITDLDKTPIAGAIGFIERLNRKNIKYAIVTNNTKEPSHKFIKYLKNLGFSFDEKNYIDPLMLLSTILKTREIKAYGLPSFIETLQEMGYETDSKNPEAILISVKKDYTSSEFAEMIDFVLNGAEIFGMHKTSIYVKDEKRYPGVGAILEMISFATGKNYKIIGKPSPIFYEKAKNIVGANKFEDITMVSDDWIGDLIGAGDLGMKKILVLSGKIKKRDEVLNSGSNQPDRIINSVRELLL